MKHKLLFLDDDPHRHALFSNFFAKNDHVQIDHVTTCDEACEALEAVKYDVAYLDHDLSVKDNYCEPGSITHAKTGSDVAKYIVENLSSANIPTLIIIHSFNPVGAKYMQDLFNDKDIKNIWRPFDFHNT